MLNTGKLVCFPVWVEFFFYRPQTKFAKVMFSQVSVCPRGGGPGVPDRRNGHCNERYASYWNAFLFCDEDTVYYSGSSRVFHDKTTLM